MTAQHRPKVSAITAAKAKSAKDIRSPLGLCPLMNKKVQLLPLRYGLVEHLDPAGELSMPLKLNSQPLGIRLLRDGYLYIIDDKTAYLHEYRIEQGQITQLLWNSQEVSGDKRTEAVGAPHLIFDRQHTLYASYSEIQWTAYKCSQVLKDKGERERLMQRIDLANVCPTHGGTHLLSKSQAQKWLAEVAESMPKTDARGATGQAPANPLPEGANPEESQPYHWENPALFQDTGLEILTSKVLGLYQDDYLFLVLRDDFGVMRDLASAQLKVSDWIEHWSADDQRQVQYLTGTYIQSLYEVNATRLQTESTTDPAVKALMDDTTGQQQSKIYEYLKLRRDQPDPGVYGDEAHWRKAAQINPLAQAIVDMKEAMGQALYQRHQSTIGKLSAQTWEALFGEAFGQRGIDHLVDRASMEAFVSQQQTLLSHWHKRLSHIREDRLGMITGGHFHRAAWYYDFHLDKQIQHRLETEFVCVAALCPDRSSAEKLAAYRNSNLLVVVPGLETLDLTAQMDVAKKLADLSSFTINVLEIQKSYAEINLLTNQFRSLMNERLPNYALLNTQFKGMQSLLEGAYNPARQLKVADQLDRAYETFKQGQHIDPNDYIRNIGPAARLELLREFSSQGLTLRAASATET